MIVDSRVAIFGSNNAAKSGLVNKMEITGVYDEDVDPLVVRDAQQLFWQIWNFDESTPTKQVWNRSTTTELILTTNHKSPYATFKKLANAATSTINAAINLFTDQRYLDVLLAALDRGVAVRVIFDAEYKGSTTHNYVSQLRDAGAIVKFFPHDSYSEMHAKMMVFDNDVAVTGSFNWVKSCDCKSGIDLNLIHSDREVALNIKEQWRILWDDFSVSSLD